MDLQRGVIEIFPDSHTLTGTDRKLRVKLGFDPTSSNLHLGHLVLLNKAKQFQSCGHKVFIILGDFTARVGDPSGRNTSRPVLGNEEIAHNAASFRSTLEKFLLPGVEFVENSAWLSKIAPEKLLTLMSMFTANQMLAKEDFRGRYTSGNPIGMHEFVYPLLQGFDSLHIGANVELGGSDQKFNISIGRDIQKRFGNTSSEDAQVGVLMPILPGKDGLNKMSKSLGNTINLEDSPLEMYSKLEKVPDFVVEDYLTLLTNVPISEFPQENREKQKFMALRVTEVVHGAEAAREAQSSSERIILNGATDVSNVELVQLPEEFNFPMPLYYLLAKTGLASGVNDAKRKIVSGAIRIDNVKVDNVETVIDSPEYLLGSLIRLSKTRFVRFRP